MWVDPFNEMESDSQATKALVSGARTESCVNLGVLHNLQSWFIARLFTANLHRPCPSAVCRLRKFVLNKLIEVCLFLEYVSNAKFLPLHTH
jgi:hypothetical protein